MRVVLPALLLALAFPAVGRAQAIDAQRAGPARAATRPPAAHDAARTLALASTGSCAYSWGERALAGAAVGGALGAGLGYTLAVLSLAPATKRQRAALQGGIVGAGIGAVWGATVSCEPGGRGPAPPRRGYGPRLPRRAAR